MLTGAGVFRAFNKASASVAGMDWFNSFMNSAGNN
jgi:hypothetical protein